MMPDSQDGGYKSQLQRNEVKAGMDYLGISRKAGISKVRSRARERKYTGRDSPKESQSGKQKVLNSGPDRTLLCLVEPNCTRFFFSVHMDVSNPHHSGSGASDYQVRESRQVHHSHHAHFIARMEPPLFSSDMRPKAGFPGRTYHLL